MAKIEPEITFLDKNLGLAGLHKWGNEIWIFRYNQCNDEWISVRKATEDDIEAVDKLLIEKVVNKAVCQ